MVSIGDKPNIILIGFSTTGKSTAGRLLAQRLGWAFIDTDLWIVGMAGQSIPEIFEQQGEATFRKLECQALDEALARQRAVIATGGGAVIDPMNRRTMAERGWIVLLEAEPRNILDRMKAEDTNNEVPMRPLLAGDDPLQRIIDLKTERHVLYHALADTVIHTDDLDIEGVVQQIISWLETIGA